MLTVLSDGAPLDKSYGGPSLPDWSVRVVSELYLEHELLGNEKN